jgi:20S proteasome alpha/beta subunit
VTIIAGIVTCDGVVLGADRMASSCNRKQDSGPKVFARDGWAFAVTGSVRSLQIMETVSKGRKIATREDVIALANALYEALKENGLGLAAGGELPEFDTNFLIATPEGLFTLYNDFSVIEEREGFAASGIGYEYALGVLLDGIESGPADGVDLVRRAIRAANALNPHCGGGPDIVRVALREQKEPQAAVVTEMGDGARE